MPRKPPRSTEERLVRAQKSMLPGTLGGRVASAAPMALDVTRLDPRLRANHDPGSVTGGFDPNADPVVIGNSASSTDLGAVAIGLAATTVAADSAVAIGRSTFVNGSNDVAVGRGATTGSSGEAVAVGYRAFANGAYSTATGGDASATADQSTALGAVTTAGYTYSTAVGYGAVTIAPHQIMLGTSAEYAELPGPGLVLKDTATGIRYIVQVTSGALVLNSPPW